MDKNARNWKPKIVHFYSPFYQIMLKCLQNNGELNADGNVNMNMKLNMKLNKEFHGTHGNKIDLDLDLFNNSFINGTTNVKQKKLKRKSQQDVGNKNTIKFRKMD